MQSHDKINVRPWILVAAVFGLTLFALIGTLKTPARVAAHPARQATTEPTAAFTATITPTLAAGQSVNACGVVMSANFVTPTVTVTATTVAETSPTAVVTPTEAITMTNQISPTEKVLRIGEDVYPAELDPQRVSFVNEFEIVELAYEGLTITDPSGRVQPGAAESYVFTPDQKQLTFTLRDGLKRVDGTPITAKDFELAAMRALDPCLGGRQYAALLYDIQGAQALSEFDVDTGTVADLKNAQDNVGIEATDDKTLVLTFAEPAGDFWLNVASLPVFYPVDTKLAAENPDGWAELAGSHNGNGAFVILSMDDENTITLVANPNYWRGRPKLDKIVFKYNPDNQAQLDAYTKGELDIDAAVTAELVPQIVSGTLASELSEYDAAQTYALAFNNTLAPFNDRIVRTAFSQAIDREAFVRDVLLGSGTATTRWIPAGVPGSQPDKPGVPDADTAAAVKTLVDNGYGKDGKVDCAKLGDIKFTYPDSPFNQVRVDYLVKNLNTAFGCTNITANPISPIEFTRITNDVKTNPQLSLQRWVEDYPHPQSWLSAYWTCGSFAKAYGYCNVYLDELLHKADSTADLEAAIQLYQQAEDLLIQDVPGAFLYNPSNLYLVKPNVTGPVENKGPRDGGWIGEYGPIWQYDITQ